MRSTVSNAYRTEEVHLQPHGNTVTVTTLAENPFENEGEIEVVTQNSGGMSGPDPEMTSRVQHHRRGGMWGGQRPAIRPVGLPPGHRRFTNAIDESLNGLGDDVYTAGVMASIGSPSAPIPAPVAAPVPESKPFNWDAFGKITTGLATAAGGVVSAQMGAKTSASQAKAADAAARAEQSRTLQASLMSRTVQTAKSNWPILVGGIAVLGLGIFLLMRKKSAAPATNPRRRRSRR